ncbi:hypothetical protein [Streptomyces flavidovirens]|uniref:Integrase n=1 Tax=Streptomyces flavidovirens TaxID=67298 RepID=A0ABW6RFU8_9ACTN
MPATIALLRTPPPKHFEPVEVRRALREYAFNVRWRTDPENPVPADVQTILDWVQRNALPVSAWEKTETIDKVVTALGTLLGGTAAAASSVTRNDRIMSLVMGYAIRHNYLKANPLTKGKGQRAAPKVAQAIDKRCLLNRDLVAKMLDWIGKRPRRGRWPHTDLGLRAVVSSSSSSRRQRSRSVRVGHEHDPAPRPEGLAELLAVTRRPRFWFRPD